MYEFSSKNDCFALQKSMGLVQVTHETYEINQNCLFKAQTTSQNDSPKLKNNQC